MLDLTLPRPFVPLDDVVGAGRIAFGLMFAVKLYFSLDARRLVWAHRVPFGNQRALTAILAGLVLANICFVLGLFTGPAALAQYVLYLLAWRYASLFGLEDVAFHMLCLYFALAGAGSSLSLDHWLGTGLWGRLPSGTVIPELALATAMGNIFLSAGVTKLFSPMWRTGLGAYYFFLLPNFRRLSTALITRNERVIRLVNTLALVMEMGFLPAVMISAIPLGLVFWIMGVGFTISLATVFVLTWIGEAMTVGMVIVAWLLWDTGTSGLAMRWMTELTIVSHPADVLLVAVLVGTLLASLLAAIVPDAKLLGQRPLMVRCYRIARLAARFTWGFLPCDVFTEAHMQGSIVYRVYAHPAGGGATFEVFRIYGPTCGPGPDRFMRPTFYEVTAYKVAEVCMELDAYGDVKSPERLRFLLRLSDLIVNQVQLPSGQEIAALTFSVIQLVPPTQFEGAVHEWYSAQPWRDAFRVTFRERQADRLTSLIRPILNAPTGRDLDRNSFEVNPMSN